jgi:hypothetical protein
MKQYIQDPKVCKVCSCKKEFPQYCGMCQNLKNVSEIIAMHQEAISEIKRMVKTYLLGVDIDKLKR